MSAQLRLPVADVSALAAAVRRSTAQRERPTIVALDGRSGAGKSTLAKQLATELEVCLIDGDSFFAGGVELRHDTPEARAHACIDWRSQRTVLEALRAGRDARYHEFDWDAFDGTLAREPTILVPARVVILEGVYAARPELADLVDLRVVLRVSDATRRARLLAREGSLGPWELQWHEAEEWYFDRAAPLSGFDVIVDGDGSPAK